MPAMEMEQIAEPCVVDMVWLPESIQRRFSVLFDPLQLDHLAGTKLRSALHRAWSHEPNNHASQEVLVVREHEREVLVLPQDQVGVHRINASVRSRDPIGFNHFMCFLLWRLSTSYQTPLKHASIYAIRQLPLLLTTSPSFLSPASACRIICPSNDNLFASAKSP